MVLGGLLGSFSDFSSVFGVSFSRPPFFRFLARFWGPGPPKRRPFPPCGPAVCMGNNGSHSMSALLQANPLRALPQGPLGLAFASLLGGFGRLFSGFWGIFFETPFGEGPLGLQGATRSSMEPQGGSKKVEQRRVSWETRDLDVWPDGPPDIYKDAQRQAATVP